MRNMGGLERKMPITYITYLIGTLALAGIIPFAGFWSKDEILADSWLAGLYQENVLGQISGYIALGLLLVAAAFTAFYMWRQMELVFFGEARSEAAAHAPESNAWMTIPLLILSFFSIFIGFINTPSGFIILSDLFGPSNLIHNLEWSLANVHPYPPQGGQFNLLIALPALALGIGGILLARRIYGKGKALTADRRDPLAVNPSTGAIWKLANARLHWDAVYYTFFERPYNQIGAFFAKQLDWAFWHDYVHNDVLKRGFDTLGNLLSKPVDLGLIDGAVNGLGRLIAWASGRLRRVQTGYVRTYAVSLLLGVVFVIVIILLPMIQTG
jgi:NADH-quinone oxidoreductase subunit L